MMMRKWLVALGAVMCLLLVASARAQMDSSDVASDSGSSDSGSSSDSSSSDSSSSDSCDFETLAEQAACLSLDDLFDEAEENEEDLPSPAAKHIVVILADDQGFADVGYNNGGAFPTDTVDYLASKGTKLTRFYASPTCTPTRASLLTGKYATNTNLYDGAIIPIQSRCLESDTPLLNERLKTAGYATHAVGKAHLGHGSTGCYLHNRGFDSWNGLLNGAHDHFGHDIGVNCGSAEDNFTAVFSNNCSLFNAFDLHDGDTIVPDATTYSTDLWTARAQSIISAHDREEPLFLYLAHTAPHTPMQALDEDMAACEGVDEDPRSYDPSFRQKICAMTVAVDRSTRSVLEALYVNQMLSDTIILYMSDNGGLIQAGSTNAPFRDGKASLFEGGTRVPAFIFGPGFDAREEDGKVHVSDLLPTLMHAAGAPLSATELAEIDGFDIHDDLVQGNTLQRNEIIVDSSSATWGFASAIIVGDYKYLLNPGIIVNLILGWPHSAMGEHLYDLNADPGETNNLVADPAYTTIANQLRLALAQHRAQQPPSGVTLPFVPQTIPNPGGCWLAMDDPRWPPVLPHPTQGTVPNPNFAYCAPLLAPQQSTSSVANAEESQVELYAPQAEEMTREEFQDLWLARAAQHENGADGLLQEYTDAAREAAAGVPLDMSMF